MPKAIIVHANDPQASLVEGSRLVTRQPRCSATVIIAVVGSYKSETGIHTPANKPDKFLCLLSIDGPPEKPQHSDESPEQCERRRQIESHLPSIRQSRYCNRYLSQLENRHKRQLYHNAEQFCDAGCSHGPSPSTFPGKPGWTFASGAASFDAAREEGRRSAADPLAPETIDYARALDALGNMVCTAVMAGLGDLEIAVSVTDTPTALGPNDKRIALGLQTLNSRVFDMVIGWIEKGWVARDDLDVTWRPFGTPRILGILGRQSTPSFMIYDEE